MCHVRLRSHRHAYGWVVKPGRSTSDALVEATIESIHRHGLEATTVTTITELAGVSRGMVRHTFASKQAMLASVLHSLCEAWTDATEPDPAHPGADQVRAIVQAMFAEDVFTDARVDAWLALSTSASTDDELRRIREQAYERWTSQLAGAFDAAGCADPVIAARGLLAAADGLWLRHRLEPSMMTRRDAEEAALAVATALLPAD